MQQKHLYTAAGNAHSNIFGIIPPALPFSLSGLETRRKKPDHFSFSSFLSETTTARPQSVQRHCRNYSKKFILVEHGFYRTRLKSGQETRK
jgi:hypothetical protein